MNKTPKANKCIVVAANTLNVSFVLTHKVKHFYNKYNGELQRIDPGIKVTGEFSTRGSIFPANAQN